MGIGLNCVHLLRQVENQLREVDARFSRLHGTTNGRRLDLYGRSIGEDPTPLEVPAKRMRRHASKPSIAGSARLRLDPDNLLSQVPMLFSRDWELFFNATCNPSCAVACCALLPNPSVQTCIGNSTANLHCWEGWAMH